MIHDMIARGWQDFLVRHNGPLDFRFIRQPAVAKTMAMRAGLNDARERRLPFFGRRTLMPPDRK